MGLPQKDNRLTRHERLRGKTVIDRLFTQKDGDKVGFVYPFRYVWEVVEGDNSHAVCASVLFSVPKKNHKKANVRNTLKRRTREAYRLNKSILGPAATGRVVHLALIYASRQQEEFKPIEDAIRKIVSRIAHQIGGE